MKHQPNTGRPVQCPRWSRAIPIWLLILLIGTLFVVPGSVVLQRPPTAWAQDYRFRVPNLQMQVFVQPDASARIMYRITFENSPTASPIDIIDIGMPHAGYTIPTMRAAINDIPLTTIRRSEYVTPRRRDSVVSTCHPTRTARGLLSRIHHARHGVPGYDHP